MKKEDLPDETLRQMADAGRALKELEEEYWKSLDPDEIAIEKKCAAGLACLKAGMLEKGCEYYTSAADLRFACRQRPRKGRGNHCGVRGEIFQLGMFLPAGYAIYVDLYQQYAHTSVLLPPTLTWLPLCSGAWFVEGGRFAWL